MTLQTLISWLREVEDLACSVYSAAADCEIVSEKLAVFLRQLAEDEMWHYHLMGSAADLFQKQETSPVTVIVIDSATKDYTETPLTELLQKIETQCATENDILQTVAIVEASGWHDLFFYVINFCCEISDRFQQVPARVQAHEERIEQFLASVPEENMFKDGMSLLPEAREEPLLVFEEDPVVSKLLERLLSNYSDLTIVRNEKEALEAIEKHQFKVILIDVDTPGVDGLAFVRHAIEKDKELQPQFILQTSQPTSEIVSTASKYNMPILGKPFAIHELISTIGRTVSPESSTEELNTPDSRNRGMSMG